MCRSVIRPTRRTDGPHPPFARGCAVFHAAPSEYRAFLKACHRVGLRCAHLVASGRGWRGSTFRGDAAALAVYQNLPPGTDPVALLLRNVVYPALLHSVPVCFFSAAGEEEYAGSGRLSGLLHTDLHAVERALAEEQLIRLLDIQRTQVEAATSALSTPALSAPALSAPALSAPALSTPALSAPALSAPALSTPALSLRGALFATKQSAPALPTVDSPRGAHSSGPADIPLDASQEIAASHRAGPMRVTAPAGSGKTRTIVSRIGRLVRDGVPPGSILPLAFNRKAAAEMTARLVSLGLGDVHARTIHSLGYEIVRRETGYVFDDQPAVAGAPPAIGDAPPAIGGAPPAIGGAPPAIGDAPPAIGDAPPVIARGAFGAPKQSPPTSEILPDALRSVYPGRDLDEVIRSGSAAHQLSAVKTNLLDPDRLQVRAGEESLPFGPVFRRCLEIHAERRLIDFDDMVYMALNVLLDDCTARRLWQDRWTHILVDEFQDLNASQMLLLRILAHPRDNLFVVGDDDQAIYGWRGASVRGLLDFRANWPSASVCVLSTNYRSASRIVSHAGWLIAMNSERVPKDVRVRVGAPQGSFLVRLAPGLRAQAREAARWIRDEMNGSGLRWSDFAVLYRYNALAFIVTIALEEYGIPHDPQNTGLLFASRAGQDVIAWLRYLADRPVPGDLTRILSRPVRILPPAVASGVRSRDDLPPLLRNCPPGGTTGRLLGNFLDATARLGPLVRALPAGEFLEALDRAAGFRSARRRAPVPEADPDDADDATCFDVIQAMACGFQSADDFLTHAEGLLKPATPSPEETGTRDAVVLSTVHRAKGNEYSRVVFFDMSRRRRPRREEIEEERRVAYVGLTRARDALLVTAESRRQSPFLREAALNPACRMLTRVDLANKLRVLRRRYARACRRTRGAARRADASHLRMEIDSLEEEFLCRSMLNAHAP